MNGYAAHAKTSVAASRDPPKRRPASAEAEHAESVEEKRGRVGSPELVPLPAPSEHRVAGHVSEVGHRAVRVATWIGRFAAPVRLNALPDLALGIGGAARLQVLLHRHVSVGRLAVHDPVRADDPGEADVDHASLRLHVQPDPEPGEEDGNAGEQPDRPDGSAGSRRAVTPGDPDTAAEQVDERRVRERRAPEDLALVEHAK